MTFSRNDFQEALGLYRQLSQLHRDGRDTYYLGLAEQNTRNTDKAIEALKRAIEIEPEQVSAHAALQAIYLSLGKAAEAEQHRRAAEANQQIQQRYARGQQQMRQRAADEASQ